MHFHFRSIRISFISKITRIHKATTAENDKVYVHLFFVLNFPYEETTKFVQVTKPAGLPVSYEEALSQLPKLVNVELLIWIVLKS